ncbi:MAG: four helix bundle protein [Patescibacteria group bacterium]
MPEQNKTNKLYNLEDRTLEFSKRVANMCNALPKNYINIVYINQILRSGSSIGANYIEANESLGKKDFKMKVRIARKEAKETTYWLNLIIDANPEFRKRIEPLLQESIEIRNILSTIINKSN